MLANKPSSSSSSSSVPSTAPTTPAIAPDGSVDNGDADGENDNEQEEEEDQEEDDDDETRRILSTMVHTSTDGIVITTAKFDDAIKKGLINIKQCHADVDIREAPDNLPLLLKKPGNVFSSGSSSIYKNVCRNGSKWSVRLHQ
jgi:hypothetical protein